MKQWKIATNIYFATSLLAIALLAVGLIGINTLSAYKTVIDQMAHVSRAAVLSERVDGLINAIVMDSRGIYLSEDQAQAEKYLKPMMNNLTALSSIVKDWEREAPTDRGDAFMDAAAATEKFIATRMELARLSREVSVKAARDFGDNDVPRRARIALSKSVDVLAHATTSDVAAINQRVVSEYDRLVVELSFLIVISLVLGFGGATIISKRAIVGPINEITGAMKLLAAGDLTTVIPHENFSNELGVMAGAVGVFKINTERATSLQRKQEEDRLIADQEKATALREMAEKVEQQTRETVGRIADLTSNMSSSATGMANSARVVGDNSTHVAVAASQALAATESVVAASEELSHSISEISRQAEQVSPSDADHRPSDQSDCD